MDRDLSNNLKLVPYKGMDTLPLFFWSIEFPEDYPFHLS